MPDVADAGEGLAALPLQPHPCGRRCNGWGDLGAADLPPPTPSLREGEQEVSSRLDELLDSVRGFLVASFGVELLGEGGRAAGGVGGVEDLAEGGGEAGGRDFVAWDRGGDAQAPGSGGVVELVVGEGDDDGGAAGSHGLGGGADAAVVDRGAAAGEDGGEGSVGEGGDLRPATGTVGTDCRATIGVTQDRFWRILALTGEEEAAAT